MLERDDVSFFGHDIADRIRRSTREEISLDPLDISTDTLEHLHRLLQIRVQDIIQDKSGTRLHSLLMICLITRIYTLHRRRLVVAERDDIILPDKNIEFVVDIALSRRLILGEVEYKEEIVIVRIETCVLILFQYCFLVEFVEGIFFHYRLDDIEWWIDIVLPELRCDCFFDCHRFYWCLGRDLNPHSLQKRILRPPRIPIPPPRHTPR
jgi:cell division protein FtsL